MSRRYRCAVVAVGLALGCDAGPKAGEVEFSLDGPRGVAALEFTVTAAEPEAIDTVTAACAGCTVYMVRSGDRNVRGVLVGPVALGAALTVTVTNIEMPELYAATVREIALADYSILSTAGFALTGPPSGSR